MIKLKPIINEISFFSWSAIVLDNESKENLEDEFRDMIPDGWTIICHHMTIDPFHQTPNNDIGDKVTLYITDVGIDDKAFAVKVKGYKGSTNNSFPHITIAINKEVGAKPKDSNNIKNWKPYTGNLHVTGIVKNL